MLLFLVLTRKGAGGQVRTKAAKLILLYRGSSFCPSEGELKESTQLNNIQRINFYKDFRHDLWVQQDWVPFTERDYIYWGRWERYYKIKHLQSTRRLRFGLDMFPDLHLQIEAGKCITDLPAYLHLRKHFRRRMIWNYDTYWQETMPYTKVLLVRADAIIQWFLAYGCNVGCGSSGSWIPFHMLRVPEYNEAHYCSRCRMRARNLGLIETLNIISDIFIEHYCKPCIRQPWRDILYRLIPPGFVFDKQMRGLPPTHRIIQHLMHPIHPMDG